MQNLSILVVDDSRTMRELLKQQLEECGYGVTVADSGDRAAALIEQADFDVVITDLMMPGGMDGLQLLEHVCRTRPNTAVVILTGHSSVDAAVAALKKGAADYFTKPYRMEELCACLDAIARQHEIRQTLAAVEAQREQGFQDLQDIAEKLHRKCHKAERALRKQDDPESRRIRRALEILSS
jgi:two-component system, OmpR family, response regulator